MSRLKFNFSWIFNKTELKKLFFISWMISFIMISCQKEDPMIAEADEMPVVVSSGAFYCQPVTTTDALVAIVKEGSETLLVKYNANAEVLWQQAIDTLMFSSFTFENINYINLLSDSEDNFLVSFYAAPVSPTPTTARQLVKSIKYNNNGDYLWQFTDSIHQPKTIITAADTFNIGNASNFQANGFVSLPNGDYAVVSSQKLVLRDSTYIQLTYYSTGGIFKENRYYVIPGKREFIHVYTNKSGQLFLPNTINNQGAFYTLIDESGNIIFDLPAAGLLLDTYFMFESSSGEYLVSASYLDPDAILRGVILSIDPNGNYIREAKVFNMSPSQVMLSAHEVSDGYIFSGFNTANLLINGVDWRTTFSQEEHHAVVLKTDFELNNSWVNIINGVYFSTGAAVLGENPISCFGGKFDRQINSLFMLKYNQMGEIYH